MSIDVEIKDKLSRGMLFPLLPMAAGDMARRAMLVSEPLWNILNSPEGDEEWEQRVGELRADLEIFVTSSEIHPKYLFLLYPSQDGVWEIRSTDGDPSIRVLGLFPKQDVYIATNFAFRKCLGGWQSREWKDIKRLAKSLWRWLFPSYEPIITTDVRNVVSGTIDDRYYKHRG